MRTAVILLAALAVAACASGPGPGGQRVAMSSGGGLSARDRADPVGALRRLGAPDSLTPEAAKALFGPPGVERRDGGGALLTWRTPTCALALAFAADRAGALRLGAASISGRDPRAAAPPAEVCIAEALKRPAS